MLLNSFQQRLEITNFTFTISTSWWSLKLIICVISRNSVFSQHKSWSIWTRVTSAPQNPTEEYSSFLSAIVFLHFTRLELRQHFEQSVFNNTVCVFQKATNKKIKQNLSHRGHYSSFLSISLPSSSFIHFEFCFAVAFG
jgi:hypothetical protein